MLPISLLPTGSQAKIVRIKGNDEVRKHLTGMGFVENGIVTVVGNSGGGCLILKVADSRVALDCSLCCRIMVEELDAAENAFEAIKGDTHDKSARNRLWQHG